MTPGRNTAVILGAGINGSALARELALNGLSVIVVDTADVAAGTTAYSSRLIHGGLRYLEYGEFRLVRESLAERGRLLRLAPQFVHPLELFIPVSTRFTGLWQSTRRFLGWDAGEGPTRSRGLMLVRMGLRLYDAYARDRSLPKHRVQTVGTGPPVDCNRYRWLASYYDGQISFPERLALALLTDACQIAQEAGNRVEVFTYHEARLEGNQVLISPLGTSAPAVEPFEPLVVINATGAWVDQTLKSLGVPSPRLMGGTKGSHFLTAHPGLAAALDGRGIYAEASDGRPVFILPLVGLTLVGTTDESYDGDPRNAVASQTELDYLLSAVHEVFPQVALDHHDIVFSYSGVRPLPYTDATVTGAISREHSLKRHADVAVPLYSIVGGKLTTSRSLGEETAEAILLDLGRPVIANSRERTIPGGEDYPGSPEALAKVWEEIARETGLPLSAVQQVWQLCGTETRAILGNSENPAELISDTMLPTSFVRWTIRHEWAIRLDDLVERRLMLLYDQRLTCGTLRHLAELLAAEGRIRPEQIEAEVARTIERLTKHFGKHIQN